MAAVMFWIILSITCFSRSKPSRAWAIFEAMSLMALAESHLLVSPYEGQDSAIVLTAWGRRLAVESWDDPAAGSFLDQYLGERSPTAPEPGAPCSGAIGDPPAGATTDYDVAFDALS